ncbi:hypothetical protein SAMN06265182_0653 [Persephonella hydrogeniphila]|uniref:Uncharacterized protein n=1 Tax=Persephonella hydrogeniphila TaxID=198703 RepID=A0A285NAA5_9AQUI|nr:hypothetical protein [Persephonella hydrogeniphila]SNZ06369.1 hypothetical protein SAMN06265182_0653 [Persephonella hydrogeniphila]
MEQVKQIMIVLDGIDIENVPEDELTDILMDTFKDKGYTPTDRPVVVRKGKVSSIRAVENDSQEEVEIYTVAQVINKDGKLKTVITGRVV